MAPEIAKMASVPVEPRLRGDWDGWAMPDPGAQAWNKLTAKDGTGWRTYAATLPPGTYRYAIDVAGVRVLDENNPRTAFVQDPDDPTGAPFGVEVSEQVVPDCTQPLVEVLEAHGGADGVWLRARFVRGNGGPALDPTTLAASLSQAGVPTGAPLTITREGPAGIRVLAAGLQPGKYTFELQASDASGRPADPVHASAFVEAQPDRALADGLVYQIMVDRFRGPQGALAPPSTPGMRAGGTLDGVRAALEAGYFDRLGVTTLWLSPVYQNPAGVFVGRDGRLYESYHGYWPSQPRSVEDLFGGEAALDKLIASAHARGVRVVLDVVPHHVHTQHPYWLAHSRQSTAVAQAQNPLTADWFLDGPDACVCGEPGCDWGSHMESCWFDGYLPTLNLRNPDVRATAADDLAWWTQRFDVDGLRIDAVPMMPRAATRRIVEATRDQAYRRGLDRLLLGEIFTGPGEDGRASIRAYLGEAVDGLDSAFDFPLMWSLRGAIAHGDGSLADVEAQLAAATQDYQGSDVTLAHMLDNHDTSRFLSEAADPNVSSRDPWLAPPAQPTDAAPYARQLLAFVYLLTTPGLPVIYYGDELGLAGASDPDSRRVLPDVLAPGALPAPQAQLLTQVSRLGRLRRCSAALRSTDPSARQVALLDPDHLVTIHGGSVIAAISRAATPSILHVDGASDGSFVDVLSGARVTVVGGSVNLNLAPLSAAVFLSEASECNE
jgi:glycosidase